MLTPPVTEGASTPEAAPAPAAETPAAAPIAVRHPGKKARAAKAAPASAGGSRYAQLASLKDKGAAAATWARLQKQFPELKGMAYRVQEGTVAGGTVYRLQAGPFDAGKAKSVCTSVTAQKPGACIVVRH
jgi:hypothetical protein